MRILDATISTMNLGVNKTFNSINKIVSNPFTVQKAGDLTLGILSAVNFKTGRTFLPELVTRIQGTNELIYLFSTCNDIVSLLNPFQTEKVNKEQFITSLKNQLVSNPLSTSTVLSKRKIKALKKQESEIRKVEKIANNVLEKGKFETNSRTLHKILETTLIEEGYESAQASKIAKNAIIKINPLGLVSTLTTLLDTICDVSLNLDTLQNWKVLNLASLSNQIGSSVKVLSFVGKLSIDFTVRACASLRFSISVIDAAHRFINAQKTMKLSEKALHSDTKELKASALNDIYDSSLGLVDNALPFFAVVNSPASIAITLAKTIQEMKDLKKIALWDILSASLDLLDVGLPLFVTLNPPVFIALTIVAKGTGLFKILKN